MKIRLAQLSDNIRTAILGGGLTVYFLPYLPDNEAGELGIYGYDGMALASGDKIIGGVTLSSSDDWYVVETLWASSPAGAVTILYAMLEHYKKILPSNDISPAAQAVVNRFYNKYKGTDIVEEGIQQGNSSELEAGYVWSPKLRKVPVMLGKVTSSEELLRLWGSVVKGFSLNYSDPGKTKREDPDGLLKKKDFSKLLEVIQHWLDDNLKSSQATNWIATNKRELENIGNQYTEAILKLYLQGFED